MFAGDRKGDLVELVDRGGLSLGVAVTVACLAAGCSPDDEVTRRDRGADHVTTATSPTTAAPRPPVAPAAYRDEVEEAVRTHAYYADRVDWEWWEEESAELAQQVSDSTGTYQLVGDLLAELDRHSELQPPGGVDDAPDELPPVATPSVEVSGAIGSVELPGVASAPTSDAGREYASIVRRVLDEDACGWVVDLRRNTGGHTAPMLAAVSPLLGPGPTVAYRERDGTTHTFAITDDGDVRVGDRLLTDGLEAPPFRPRSEPVAVLHGQATASAGESVVMAFRGRPDTRSFGRPTDGLPTGVEGFDLSDGSILHLTTAVGVDPTGVEHHDSIPPDVELSGPDALDAAHAWLAGHPACRDGR